jgi:hypothetical protein
MATNKLDVKKIIKGIVKNKKKRDIVSLILIVNNLEHKRISVEGNDTLKPIDSIEELYMFFLMYIPEAILSAMTPKSKFVSTKKRDLKEGEKQKEEDEYDDHDSNELTTENKAFILKYLFLYAKIYSKISNRDEIIVEKSRLMKLLSLIDTPKLSVKALSWLIVSFKSEESILPYLRSYIKTCITIQKPAIENALNVVSTLIPYFELDATIKSFFLPFYNFLTQACKKFRHKLRKSKTDVNEKTADEIISESYLNICTLCYHIISKLQNNARTDLRIRE